MHSVIVIEYLQHCIVSVGTPVAFLYLCFVSQLTYIGGGNWNPAVPPHMRLEMLEQMHLDKVKMSSFGGFLNLCRNSLLSIIMSDLPPFRSTRTFLSPGLGCICVPNSDFSHFSSCLLDRPFPCTKLPKNIFVLMEGMVIILHVL